MKKPKYEVIYPDDNTQAFIRILSGKYKGLEYKYLVVRPREMNGEFVLSFTYDIIAAIETGIGDDINQIMGEILREIIVDGKSD